MERRAELMRTRKNMRYKMVSDTDGHYYLLDGDYNIGGYFLVALNWLFPQKFYEVTKDQLEKIGAGNYIDANHSYGSMGGALAMLGVVFGPKILQKVTERISFSISLTGRYTVVASIAIVILILRMLLSYSQKKRLTAILDLRDLKVVKARIVPVTITKGHWKFIFCHLFGTLILVGGPIRFIQRNDLSMLMGLLVGALSLVFNLVAFSDGEYIMKFKDKVK